MEVRVLASPECSVIAWQPGIVAFLQSGSLAASSLLTSLCSGEDYPGAQGGEGSQQTGHSPPNLGIILVKSLASWRNLGKPMLEKAKASGQSRSKCFTHPVSKQWTKGYPKHLNNSNFKIYLLFSNY